MGEFTNNFFLYYAVCPIMIPLSSRKISIHLLDKPPGRAIRASKSLVTIKCDTMLVCYMGTGNTRECFSQP